MIHETTEENDDLKESNEIVECVSFSCDMPKTSGRGFMEVRSLSISNLIMNELSPVYLFESSLLDDYFRLKTKDSAAVSSLS